jgi:outer membrane protein assembly factor BamB/tetratricopeptide (TPR) repeat protein
VRKSAAVLAAAVLAAAAAFGQEKPAEEKRCENRLKIADTVDLTRDLARLDNAEKQKNWEKVVALYDELLERTYGKLVESSDGLFTSAGEFLRERMAKLGPRAREVYRIVHDRAAERAFEAASQPLDEKLLEKVVRDYSLSSYADDALSLLAAVDAERGDFEGAIDRLDRLIAWCPDTDLDRDLLLIRAAWYSYYAGQTALAKGYLGKVHPDDGTRIEQAVRYRVTQLTGLLEKDKRKRGRYPFSREEKKGKKKGNVPFFAGVSGEVAPVKKILWQGSLFGTQNARKCLRESAIQSGRRRRPLSPGSNDFRYQSVEYGARVYAGTEVGLNVFDLRTGRLLMELLPPGGGDYFPELDSLLAPTVTKDSVYANFVFGVSKGGDYRAILIKAAMPRYTLCAYEGRSGKLKWAAHKSEKLKKKFSGKWFSLPSSPVLIDGTLIAEVKTSHLLVRSYLAAFDSETGEVKWIKYLCSNGTDRSMFHSEARGPLSTSLARSRGPRPTVYCCTNSGAVFALDATSGEVRWAASYDQIQLRAARGVRAQMRNLVWSNCPPVLTDGVLVVAPLDSEYVHAFDAKTGEMLWRLHHSWQGSQFKYVLGALDGRVILAGARLAAIECRSGKVKWLSKRYSSSAASGRGLVTPTQVVVPLERGIYRFQASTGKLTGIDNWEKLGIRMEPGNLLEADGRLIVTGTTKVTVYGKQAEK